MAHDDDSEAVARYADMLSAMGTEPRLRILRLLLAAHPELRDRVGGDGIERGFLRPNVIRNPLVHE